jgi:hypothetical protein
VLLSPHAFGPVHQVENILQVSLTRKQIEGSPSIESHKTVSRQYEEEYHRYYGWPFYWEGDGLWGGRRGFPILESPATTPPAGHPAPLDAKSNHTDLHLRSAQTVNGYHIHATDGTTGHICDFMMDDESWAIRQLVVKIGHRFNGKEVLIPVNCVDRISYDESSVFVKLTKEVVEQSPAYDQASVRVAGFDPAHKNNHAIDKKLLAK